MIKEQAAENRPFKTDQLTADLVVVGGGVAGTCCALTAARAGIRVILIQDRPVLGGNASSEVRLWLLGATAHMHNNNRWSREGGVLDEILVENMYRNKEGNALIFDTVLLEKVVSEPNITLLLNTAVIEVFKSGPDTIEGVRAFCSQNSTMYEAKAPLFCDASGDGVVGFLSGAAFRMGAEASSEFGEKFAPSHEYGELLGHSIYFYSKDTGKPVKFVPPSYALDDITKIPRYRSFNSKESGCRLWWIEYGGRLDTVHDTEKIKWELWKVVYGVWNYIKNSGEFPDAENLTLEWVGHIPGKRESRRFEGPYMLTQQDIVEQHSFYDAVSFGGWSIDLHPADGIFSEKPGCNQWHSRGVFQIPYRCMYSRNLTNLFLAGRIISASHVAFGSTRVIGTCSNSAQAVGMAAALCIRQDLLPDDISAPVQMAQLQKELIRNGQFIPGLKLDDPEDLVQGALIETSSIFRLAELKPDGPVKPLVATGQWLPLEAGPTPSFTFYLDAGEATEVTFELRTSNRPDNYTPDVLLASRTLPVAQGENQAVRVDFEVEIDQPRYALVSLAANPRLKIHYSAQLLTGTINVEKRKTENGVHYSQEPDQDIGVETFDFWCPPRRPAGHNLALSIEPPLCAYKPEFVANGFARPTFRSNAWLAALDDDSPTLKLRWSEPQTISRVELSFDTDFDHAMETTLLGHPEDVMPFCIKRYSIQDGAGKTLYECSDNHQTRNSVVLNTPVTTDALTINLCEVNGSTPPALFEVRCYR
ncbi:MAG: FAD-dependent oxidoreductase [Chloroflexi bacterium]|nr:FAD-dependent oxidoreductase [Chloroflexota bacterium]OJV90119.1 MAG: FAD-binding dehydrogenase [Chloroflexi bacterium 54-19]